MSRPSAPFGVASRVALAVLGGLLLVVAHLPWGWLGFAGPLALVFLVAALDQLGPRSAFAVGLSFGAAFHLAGYHWLVYTMVTFGGFPRVIAILFFVAIGVYQALSLAVVAWLASRLGGRGVPAIAAFPLALGAVEAVYPLLFPSYLASALHQTPLLLQAVELGGPILVSMLLAAAAVWVDAIVRARLRRFPLPFRAHAGLVALLVVWVGFGAVRMRAIDLSDRQAARLTVGLVQASVPVAESQRTPAIGHARNVAMSRVLVRDQELDLLVWPESAYPWSLPGGFSAIEREVMRGGPIGVPFLFGAGRSEASGRDFNTAFLLDRDGSFLGTYDKAYLLMFGEYLPFGETLPKLYEWSPGTARLTPGEHQRPLVFDGNRVAVLMCYEDLLPGFTRRAVHDGKSQLLVNLTNDAWFGDTVEPWFHLALSKLRAIETRRWLVRSTNTGISGFIDPVGRLVRHGGQGTQETLVHRVSLRDDVTFYARVGDWPGAVALGLVVWLGFARGFRSRRVGSAPAGCDPPR